MTRKHAELEREFIDDLLSRTGHSLGEWMVLIDTAGLAGKNEIIDWLRPKGFTFANASWLERIHNNGGRPIYIDIVAAAPSVSAPAAQPAPAPRAAASPPAPRPRPSIVPPALGAAVMPGAGEGCSLPDTLARGKAFRPLAEMLVRQIEGVLPKAVLIPAGELVAIGNPSELAVLHVSPRELKLGLDLGAQPFEWELVKARIPGAGPRITHMIVLTDARQVGAALLDLVRQADRSANPSG